METLAIKDREFTLELAVTQRDWVQGLSGRDTLSKDNGLLFVYGNSGVRKFWMKGMYFPIDIICLDQYGNVVNVLRDLQPSRSPYPETYSTKVPIKYAMEVNAGEADSIEVGDRVNTPGKQEVPYRY